MTAKIKTSSLIAVALFLTVLPQAAFAEDAPELAGLLAEGATALMEEVDARHNYFEDQTLETRFTIIGGESDGNELVFTTITKGDNKRAIRFSEPADMKGMGVVIKGADEIYVLLPDSDKVRRVGAHAKKQSFQGTTWNFDDMSTIRFLKDFSPVSMEETDTHIKVTLELTSGADIVYDTLVVHVNREHIMAQVIEYWEDGTQIKEQRRDELGDAGSGFEIYTAIEMEEISSGVITTTDVLSEEIDTGVKDSTFSKKWLVRGQ